MPAPSPCLTYAAIALAKAIEVTAQQLGLHLDPLPMLTEVVILLCYIKLARAH